MLKLTFIILSWLYGLIMGGSATLMFYQEKLPIGLWAINCIGALLLIIGQYTRPVITLLGLVILILAAILNGLAINNTISPVHLSIRIVLSLLIAYFAFSN